MSVAPTGPASLSRAALLPDRDPLVRAVRSSPAPLTERPGVQAEYARPHVVPLEESFADAQSVKRSRTYRARLVAMETR